MTTATILKCIEYAYKHADKLGELKTVWQDGIECVKQMFIGPMFQNGYGQIVFWFNYTLNEIETAWPIW